MAGWRTDRRWRRHRANVAKQLHVCRFCARFPRMETTKSRWDERKKRHWLETVCFFVVWHIFSDALAGPAAAADLLVCRELRAHRSHQVDQDDQSHARSWPQAHAEHPAKLRPGGAPKRPIVLRPEQPFWGISSADELYAKLESIFPQAEDWRVLVPRAVAEAFVAPPAAPFRHPQSTTRLFAHLPDAAPPPRTGLSSLPGLRGCAVVLLGDAAYSFPPGATRHAR
jgi:hypothetical protein